MIYGKDAALLRLMNMYGRLVSRPFIYLGRLRPSPTLTKIISFAQFRLPALPQTLS